MWYGASSGAVDVGPPCPEVTTSSGETMHRAHLGLFVVLLLLFGAAPFSQGLPSNARLQAVEIVGAQRLTKADVVAGLGLRVNETITVANLEAAAERLVKSGLVSDVTFRFTYRGLDVVATFTISEVVPETAVVFDNFPWFSDDELSAAVRARFPAFDGGRIANTSEAVDQVTGALATLLAGRRLPGRVEHLPTLNATTGARTHLFKVSGVSLPVCDVKLIGVQPALEDAVRRVSTPLRKRECSRSGNLAFLQGALEPLYRERGYLRQNVREVSGRLGDPASGCVGVVVVGTIEEGVTYTWQGVKWSGNHVLQAAQLDPLIPLRRNEVANGLKIDKGLKAVGRAYGRFGYLGVRVDPVPAFDDRLHEVVFEVKLEEGPQFRMGVLFLEGVDDESGRAIRGQWRLKAGDVYDEDHPFEFLDRQLRSRLGAMKVTVTPNLAARTVDVTLRFGS